MLIAEAPGRYLLVRLADRRLALPVAQVEEICRPPELESLSSDVPGLLGFALLRGLPTPVIDPAALLGWTRSAESTPQDRLSPGPQNNRRLVTLRMDHHMNQELPARTASRAALLMDEVFGVYAISPQDVHAVALPGGRMDQMGEFDHQFARLMDASALIEPAQWQQIQAAVRS